ncbi:ATP-grasp domain-containing protein [Streptomyces barkulensis]|uniref:ATP-grasp domain-containing protein n=1 Tax=Streptomyces barkulensis TaxID=1257026 RepID=UPI000C6EEE8B|nr:ATP-grasp domain-containing protein [Streptomyces barkulensis]
MIALVNPVSSGSELAAAFAEEGADCLLVHTRDQASAFHRATANGRRSHLHTELAGTAEYLRSAGVRTVIAASEFGVTLADELSELLGLPHHRHELRAARRDKYLMARALADAGLPHARTVLLRTEAELRDALDGWDAFPLVIKPLNSAGSDGCHISADAAEAVAAFRRIAGRPNLTGEVNDAVLLQEFLQGTQYIVNTVSMEGRHLTSEVYAERIDRSEGAPVLRHIISRPVLNDAERELVDYVSRCLDALGIREGAAHTEVMLTGRGPRLVEVNSRVMGPSLAPDPYHAAFGYSHQHLVVERFLRPQEFARRFELPYTAARTVAKVFLRPHRPGVLLAVEGARVLRRLAGFHSIDRLPAVGEPIHDRHLTTGRSGIAYLVHEDEDLLLSSLGVLHDLEDTGGFYRLAEAERN